jgi:hypothetical protein
MAARVAMNRSHVDIGRRGRRSRGVRRPATGFASNNRTPLTRVVRAQFNIPFSTERSPTIDRTLTGFVVQFSLIRMPPARRVLRNATKSSTVKSRTSHLAPKCAIRIAARLVVSACIRELHARYVAHVVRYLSHKSPNVSRRATSSALPSGRRSSANSSFPSRSARVRSAVSKERRSFPWPVTHVER